MVLTLNSTFFGKITQDVILFIDRLIIEYLEYHNNEFLL